MIPGSDLLAQAMGAIAPQVVQWRKAIGRTPNAQGRETAVYAPAVDVLGSFQPLSAARVAYLGLDASKRYATLYTHAKISGAGDEKAADEVWYGGEWYNAQAHSSWDAQDGWRPVILVFVKAGSKLNAGS